MVEAIINAWDSNEFAGGRHSGRVEKIDALSKLGSCRV
jgi:ribose 5-phosphate isomerase B